MERMESSWPEFDYTLPTGSATTTDPAVRVRRRKHPIGFAAPAAKAPVKKPAAKKRPR